MSRLGGLLPIVAGNGLRSPSPSGQFPPEWPSSALQSRSNVVGLAAKRALESAKGISARDLGNPQRDSVCCRLQGVICQMRIPSGCVHMIVTQQLSDHRKPFSNQQSTTGVRVAQVMNSHAFQTCPVADTLPVVVQICHWFPRLGPGDHPWIVFIPPDPA